MGKLSLKRKNVNADKNNLNNVDYVSDLSIDDLLEALNNKFSDSQAKKECLGNHLAEKLNDEKNLNYYLKLVETENEKLLYESLSITKDADLSGKIRKGNKAAYFVGVIKNKRALLRKNQIGEDL